MGALSLGTLRETQMRSLAQGPLLGMLWSPVKGSEIKLIRKTNNQTNRLVPITEVTYAKTET